MGVYVSRAVEKRARRAWWRRWLPVFGLVVAGGAAFGGAAVLVAAIIG